MKAREDVCQVSGVSGKRMEILNACIKVFSKKGYYKATIEDIASRAGVGKGTVYLYFSGKDNLFEEMLKHILCKYHNELGDILSKENESIRQRIINLIEYYKKNIEEHMDLIQIIISEYVPMSSEKVKIVFDQKRKELGDIISRFMKDGIERKEIREDIDQTITPIAIFSTIEHYYLKQIHNEGLKTNDIDDEPLIEFIMNMMK